MNHSMITAASSLYGLQRKLDIIADNVANLNTTGYKRRDASFQDILTTAKAQQPSMELPGRRTPLGLTEGWGARLSMQWSDFSQGTLVSTGQPFDLAIEGNALFELAVPRIGADGEQELDENGNPVFDRVWTRDGAFQLSPNQADGMIYLTAKDGTFVVDENGEKIAIPPSSRVDIDESGTITAWTDAGEAVTVGRLRLVRIVNPHLLTAVGSQRYALADNVPLDSALEPLAGTVTEGIAVRQGYLEQSNVDLTKEMTDLINAQRAFQLMSRALSSADTMWDLANKLRG